MAEIERPYPDVLPDIDPMWLLWNDGTVKRLASGICSTKNWEELLILADALEDAGCTNEEMISHLRTSNEHLYYSGCWERQCWLVNHLLGEQQPLVAEFSSLFQRNGNSGKATVINPGDRYGATYLVYVSDCFDLPLYVVEAESPMDAVDIFIDSEHGESERVHPEDDFDNEDYGWKVNAGDKIGGVVLDKDGWIDLRGNYVSEARTEPSVTDGNTLYDGESIHVHGTDANGHHLGNRMPFKCVYHGPGLPKEGVNPLSYFRRASCHRCDKVIYPHPYGNLDPPVHCSRECLLASVGESSDNDNTEGYDTSS